MENATIYICEDHQIVIKGVRSILSSEKWINNIESFKNSSLLFEALETTTPDILILDLNLPDDDGLSILKNIRKTNSDIKILVLTMHSDPYLVKQAKLKGANGYLLKDFGEKELLESLQFILRDEYYMSPNLEIESEVTNSSIKFQLTDREKEIIYHSASGKSSSEIGDILFLSPHTVNTHRRNIYKKLGVNNIKELVKFACNEGIV